jgi:DNA helicase-2/ATP-dependent DNA helicase PcrA
MTLSERFLAAKRRLFSLADSDLNARQREAVYLTKGPLLVIAGAGSGKTTVLVRRIAQIIRYGDAYASDRVPAWADEFAVAGYEGALSLTPDEIRPLLADFAEDPCPPDNVLAITFTNKAANEMKERLGAIFGDPDISGRIWAGTFHAICMRIIRANPAAAGCSPGTAIYDAEDQKKLAAKVIKDLGIDDRQFTVKSALSVISRAKEKLQTPGEFAAAGGGFREKTYARIYEAYDGALSASNALDFDDIIMKTVLMLRENDVIRRRYAGRFRYVCVDEYQDTNPAQFELCRLLSSVHGNIMVVGDDDQSIYRFRGATVENILGFDRAWDSVSVVKLEQNYRSTGTILSAANAVIEKNPSRHEKSLWTENGKGTRIRLERCSDESDEAARIADMILTAKAEKRRSFRDFAVLYRVNAQSNSIERIFARSAVPYRIYGGQRFNDRKEIRDIVAYLQLICNPSDRIRMRRIINEPRRKIGEQTLAAVEALADETGRGVGDIIGHAEEFSALQRSAAKLADFAGMMDRLRQIRADGCPLDAFIRRVLDVTGYRQMLVDAGEEERDRLDNLDEFVSGAVEYMRRSGDDATLEGFLEENALVADVDAYDETADAVVLMTVHSAKGLEFPVAILPGMEEGVFPGTQAVMEPSELEEERRLAYVAITRAKEELYVYYAAKRLLYGRTFGYGLSRFVADIPGELIEKRVSPARAAEERDGRRGAGYGDCGGRVRDGSDSGGDIGGISYLHRPAAEDRAFAPQGGRAGSGSAPVGTVYVPKKSAAAAPRRLFAEGDRVVHPTFGAGEIISAKQMGADVLYEIAFDTAGTKKVMATFAKLSPETED